MKTFNYFPKSVHYLFFLYRAHYDSTISFGQGQDKQFPINIIELEANKNVILLAKVNTS